MHINKEWYLIRTALFAPKNGPKSSGPLSFALKIKAALLAGDILWATISQRIVFFKIYRRECSVAVIFYCATTLY